jgi:pSer/pThr/pTyr-binding forkhead associated (FHA) protein
VNGERVRGKVELRVGDRIGVGPLLFEVSVEKPAPARQIVEPTDDEAAAMLLDDEDSEADSRGTGDSKASQ